MGKKICVCEDDALTRMAAVECFSEGGFEVEAFVCADHALEHLQQHARGVLLIFTDVEMPGETDGVQLAHIARESWPWVRILVTSGHPRPEVLHEAVPFLRKPWRHSDLMAHAAA